MSILIKGMKMPTTCDECDFCHWSNIHQTGICDRCGDEPVCPDYSTDYKRTRARFCPLIELPEEHGRCVDADVLAFNLDGTMAVSPTGYIHGDTVADMIGDAPTIIEAEGNEE